MQVQHGQETVVVTFGGGARDEETFAPEGQENIPRTAHRFCRAIEGLALEYPTDGHLPHHRGRVYQFRRPHGTGPRPRNAKTWNRYSRARCRAVPISPVPETEARRCSLYSRAAKGWSRRNPGLRIWTEPKHGTRETNIQQNARPVCCLLFTWAYPPT